MHLPDRQRGGAVLDSAPGLPGVDCSLPSLGQAGPSTLPHSLALKPPTPAVPFTCLFSPPRNSREGGSVGMSPVGGAQGEEGTGSQESFILVVIIILTVGETGGREPDH